MDKKEKLTIAIPKGKLGKETLELLGKCGLPLEGVETDSRKLKFIFSDENIDYIICRPTDVPTYVEYGAADIGIVGKDTLVESTADVFELVDLNFSECRMVVALPKEVINNKYPQGEKFNLRDFNHQRIATKFPHIASQFFLGKGMQMEVIKLHGNMELAPLAGLAELIVDIVSTGTTLKTNNLVAVETIFKSTARLIANRVSYRLKSKRLQPLVNSIKDLIRGDEDA